MKTPSVDHVTSVYGEYPRDDATGIDRQLLGRFYNDGEHFAVLSDHAGLLHDLPQEGPLTPRTAEKLSRMRESSYLRFVNRGAELADQQKQVQDQQEATPADPASLPQLSQPAPAPAQPVAPEPVFDYFRAGMDKPHVVEVRNGLATLDGAVLSPRETEKILANAAAGAATLRWRKSPLAKAEAILDDLVKAEGGLPTSAQSLASALEHMRSLVSAGHLPQEHYDTVRRELFEDPETGLGNKRAYANHLQDEGRQGVHILGDVNSLKGVNDLHGHKAGDEFIRAAGSAVRRAIDASVGSDVAKAHRIGGDEFHVHVPTHEHAAQFLRQLRTEFESVPAMGGTHRLGMSVGLGHTPEVADQAMYRAKDQKKAAVAATGADPSSRLASAPHSLYVHSLVPGHEGPVPTSWPGPSVPEVPGGTGPLK